MSFRARIALASAVAVALAVVLASAVVYFVARGQIRAPIDQTLDQRADQIAHLPLEAMTSPTGETFLALRPGFGEPNVYIQVVKSNGGTIRPPGDSTPAAGRRRGARRRAWDLRFLQGGHRRRGDASPRAHVPLLARIRGAGRAAADRGRRHAQASRAPPAPHRRRRDRVRRRSRPRGVAGGSPTRSSAHRDRRARHRDRRPVRADRRQRARRAEPSRHDVQLDARCARGVHPCAAAARGGRVPRAPDAAHEPADEHRGPRGRPCAAWRGATAAALGRRRAGG